MFSAILILLLLPITDVSRSRGMQFRPISKAAFFVFVANFLILMQLGAKHVESPFIEFGQISTVLYFLYFTVVMYGVTVVENTFVDLRNPNFTTKDYGFFDLNRFKKSVSQAFQLAFGSLVALCQSTPTSPQLRSFANNDPAAVTLKSIEHNSQIRQTLAKLNSQGKVDMAQAATHAEKAQIESSLIHGESIANNALSLLNESTKVALEYLAS